MYSFFKSAVSSSPVNTPRRLARKIKNAIIPSLIRGGKTPKENIPLPSTTRHSIESNAMFHYAPLAGSQPFGMFTAQNTPPAWLTLDVCSPNIIHAGPFQACDIVTPFPTTFAAVEIRSPAPMRHSMVDTSISSLLRQWADHLEADLSLNTESTMNHSPASTIVDVNRSSPFSSLRSHLRPTIGPSTYHVDPHATSFLVAQRPQHVFAPKSTTTLVDSLVEPSRSLKVEIDNLRSRTGFLGVESSPEWNEALEKVLHRQRRLRKPAPILTARPHALQEPKMRSVEIQPSLVWDDALEKVLNRQRRLQKPVHVHRSPKSEEPYRKSDSRVMQKMRAGNRTVLGWISGKDTGSVVYN